MQKRGRKKGKPHRLDQSAHKQKKEISVDEKSGVEHYTLKKVSVRLTFQCFLPRPKCSQDDISADRSSLNSNEMKGGSNLPVP